MSGNSLLLDTNIILYLLSGDEDLSILLYKKKLYTSFITQLELLGYPKISKSHKKVIIEFLKQCVIIDINNVIKDHTIDIRQENAIKLPDAIIMGTSKFLNIPLITSDKALTKIEDLSVIYYSK